MMKKLAAILALSTLCATSAFADNTGHAYIGADIGSSSFTNAAPWPNPSVLRIDGGYYFSNNVAVEVGYAMFGDSTFGGVTLSARSFHVAAVGLLPVSPQFDVFGKLGFASNSETWTGGGMTLLTTSANDIMYGLGAQFHVNQQLSITAQYLYYGKFDTYPLPITASSLTIGMAYTF